MAETAGSQVGMNGTRALPPFKETVTGESQSPCLAQRDSGLEGDAVPVHELTFCGHSGLIGLCPDWAPGATAALARAEGRKS